MAGTSDKGKFSTGIGQDVIEEALRAVQKHKDATVAASGAMVDLTPESETPLAETAPTEAADSPGAKVNIEVMPKPNGAVDLAPESEPAPAETAPAEPEAPPDGALKK